MSKVNTLIGRLDHCRQSGDGKWIARCPAHDDRSPSLSVKEASDGRILIHCFSGCSAGDVIAAVGLEFNDLFPDDLEPTYHPKRGPTETVDSLVIEIARNDRAMGKRLNKADTERLREAMKRKPKESDAVVEIAYESGAIKL